MPPKKAKKIALSDFLADDSMGGSWADEMDSLPTGPSGDPSAGGLGGSRLGQDRGGFGDRPNRGPDSYMSDRPPRAEVPMPTAPPFTAFVGNLTFETTESDLEVFFSGLPTSSIRIVVDQMDKKPKGFGYVEFVTLDSLKSALDMTASDLNGRTVRISVAEAPKGREGRADEDMTWVRQGPLAPLAGSGRSGGGFDRPRDAGFGSQAGAGGEEVVRDGPIRGGKFVASAPDPGRRPGGFERNASGGPGAPGGFGQGREGGFGGGRERDASGGPPEEVVRDGPIRGGKFVPTPERSAPSGGFGGDRRGSAQTEGRADEERSWTRQGPLSPAAGPRSGSFGAPRGDATPPSLDGSPQPQRQRLQLSARSTAPSSGASSPSGSPAPSRPSPFGAAKPIDGAERERLAEEKHAKEREIVQKKLAEEKEKREREPVVAAVEKKESSSSTASPFGAARPVDVSSKEKEVEEKLAKINAKAVNKSVPKVESPTVAPTSPTSPVPTPAAAPNTAAAKAALRKEGFSYSKVATATSTSDAKVEEVTKKVEGVTVA